MEYSSSSIRLKLRNRTAVLLSKGIVVLLLIVFLPFLFIVDLVVTLFNGNGFLYKVTDYLKSKNNTYS